MIQIQIGMKYLLGQVQILDSDTFPKVQKPCLQIASLYVLQMPYRNSNLTLVKMSRWILGDLLIFTLPMDSALISRLSSARRRLREEKGRGTHESKQ